MSQAKALEWWRPPTGAGQALGCLTTTFGVDMDLLHKHALGGFLDIEADPEDEEFMYLAAFEEAAAQCEALVVFLDGGHVQASIPSWRLDVVPVRSVVLHAKVTLLAWANHVRIVVGSHNMTNDGYRHNREHMGVLDFHSEACHHALLNECLGWFVELSTAHATEPVSRRTMNLLTRVRQVTSSWTATEFPSDHAIEWAFTGPGRTSLSDQISSMLSARSMADQWNTLEIVSPFFVGPEAPNRPLEWLLQVDGGEEAILRIHGRGKCDDQGADFEGPESLREVSLQHGFRPQFSVSLPKTQSDEMVRPLHAKLLVVHGANLSWAVHGSSNFTNHGWGLAGERSNIEANLMLCAPAKSAMAKSMKHWLRNLPSKHVGETPSFISADGQGDQRTIDREVLPAFFRSATWQVEEGQTRLVLEFNSGQDELVGQVWRIVGANGRDLYTHSIWEKTGFSQSVVLEVSTMTSVLKVEVGENAFDWPTAIEDVSHLPPPEELASMTLEDLLRVFADNMSMRTMLERLAKRSADVLDEKSSSNLPELNPHKRVDTSAFMLQRTRRFSYAMEGLKRRLSRPFFTQKQLDWHLTGPIGPLALATALIKDHSYSDYAVPDEVGFLLAELALELSEVQVQGQEGALPVSTVRIAMKNVLKDLKRLVPKRTDIHDDAMWVYIQSTFEYASSHVSH